jgi:transcriptional regulator of acetoin/glycerol metabolism
MSERRKISRPDLVAKLNGGMTVKAIAQELGLSRTSVHTKMKVFEIKKMSIYPNKYE